MLRRNAPTLDADREAFEKNQVSCEFVCFAFFMYRYAYLKLFCLVKRFVWFYHLAYCHGRTYL